MPADRIAGSPATVVLRLRLSMVDGGAQPSGRAQAPALVRPMSPKEAGVGMAARRFRVCPEDVVFVKGIIEASDGLAAILAEPRRRRALSEPAPVSGELTLVSPFDRADELHELISDLRAELGIRFHALDTCEAGAPSPTDAGKVRS